MLCHEHILKEIVGYLDTSTNNAGFDLTHTENLLTSASSKIPLCMVLKRIIAS